MNQNPKRNASGCKDPTAYEAIKHVSKEEQRFNELLKCLKFIVRSSGFDVVGRIVLVDRSTGREWR